jgi:hypothetical protein
LGKTNKGQATLVRLAPLNLFQGDAKFLAWLAGESSSVDLFPAVFLTGPPDRIVGLKVRRFAYRALPNADFGPLEVASERAILVIRMIGRRFKRTSKLSVSWNSSAAKREQPCPKRNLPGHSWSRGNSQPTWFSFGKMTEDAKT